MEGLPGDPVRRCRPRACGRASSRVPLSAQRRIVLLRHGRTGHNLEGRIQGQLDIELDEIGRAQALAVGEALAAASPYAVVSSDLLRALATAEAVAVAAGLTAVADERLREIGLGAWEGLTGEQARGRFPGEHAAWVAGEDIRRGGGETYVEAASRASAAVTDALSILPDGRTLVVVTHGGTARAALGSLLDLPPTDWWRLSPLGNTCWSVLVEGGRGWRLERHNAGLGPLVGAATGAHDLGSRPTGSPDVEPVK